MRSATLLAILVGAVGCGSSSTGSDAGADLSSTDLASQPPDLNSGKTGCNGYVQCIAACAGDTTCRAGCDGHVTIPGRSAYRSALSCGQGWCLGRNDMGSGDCVLDTAGTRLVDPPGRPAMTCRHCLSNALAGLFGNACNPTTDPNCNPSMCTSLYTTCMSSLP